MHLPTELTSLVVVVNDLPYKILTQSGVIAHRSRSFLQLTPLNRKAEALLELSSTFYTQATALRNGRIGARAGILQQLYINLVVQIT